MRKIPDTKEELANCIDYLIHFFSFVDRPVDEAKSLTFRIDEHPTIFTVTFEFIYIDIHEDGDPDLHTQEPKWDKLTINLIKETESLHSLYLLVESTLEEINSRKIITEVNQIDHD